MKGRFDIQTTGEKLPRIDALRPRPTSFPRTYERATAVIFPRLTSTAGIMVPARWNDQKASI